MVPLKGVDLDARQIHYLIDCASYLYLHRHDSPALFFVSHGVSQCLEYTRQLDKYMELNRETQGPSGQHHKLSSDGPCFSSAAQRNPLRLQLLSRGAGVEWDNGRGVCMGEPAQPEMGGRWVVPRIPTCSFLGPENAVGHMAEKEAGLLISCL